MSPSIPTKSDHIVRVDANNREFTAETFLAYFRRSEDRWHSRTSDTAVPNWLFRGHRDENWSLLPTLWRSRAVGEWAKDLPPGAVPDATYQACVEYYKLKRKHFHARANRLGLTSLGFPQNRDNQDSKNFFDTSDDLDSLCQHHGIPTHLLDWTGDPLVAMFFATNPIYPSPARSVDCCVWALDTTTLDWPIPMLNIKELGEIIRPCLYVNPFAAAQDAYFTRPFDTREYHRSNQTWPTLEKILESEDSSLIMKKYILKWNHVDELHRLLRREDVTLTRLMPTLDNVAKEVMEGIHEA